MELYSVRFKWILGYYQSGGFWLDPTVQPDCSPRLTTPNPSLTATSLVMRKIPLVEEKESILRQVMGRDWWTHAYLEGPVWEEATCRNAAWSSLCNFLESRWVRGNHRKMLLAWRRIQWWLGRGNWKVDLPSSAAWHRLILVSWFWSWLPSHINGSKLRWVYLYCIWLQYWVLSGRLAGGTIQAGGLPVLGRHRVALPVTTGIWVWSYISVLVWKKKEFHGHC